jgi:hypothetical protein
MGRHGGRPSVRLRVRTNSGVKVPVGQSTGCPQLKGTASSRGGVEGSWKRTTSP